jgi:hypothetical protein
MPVSASYGPGGPGSPGLRSERRLRRARGRRSGRLPACRDGRVGASAGNERGPRGAGAGSGKATREAAHRGRRDGPAGPAHRPGRQCSLPWRLAVRQRACASRRDRRGRAALPPLRPAAAPQRPSRRPQDLRRVPRQGPGPALRAVRDSKPRRPAQRRRAAHLPELLAPRPAQLEALREVREQPACRRDHRGRAGLPELPAGTRPDLQHLRVSRRKQDRDLPGNRHPGLQPVPQAVGHLLPLRDRGTAEGRHAGRATLRSLPQPRPRLLEAVRLLPGNLAAIDSGVHSLPPGPEAEETPRPARRHHPAGAGPAT